MQASSAQPGSVPRTLRFGLSTPGSDDLDRLRARARWAERAGFSTFSVSDHLDAPSPFVSLGVVAASTETMRLGTLVLNNDLHHVALLARDAATLARLSGGRFELGLGAGWARAEYVRAGIPYDTAGTRIARLAETVTVLRALFTGEPVQHRGTHVGLAGHFVVPLLRDEEIPILIGGNGDRLLSLAGAQADIVGFTGFGPDRYGHNVRTHFSRAGLADRVALVRRAAAGRAEPPELNILLQLLVVTDDRWELAERIARQRSVPVVEVLTNPFLAFGTVEEIALQLTRLRDDHGITSITVFDPHADATARVIAALTAAGE